MDLIDYRDEIITSIAETACNKLTKKVIRELQGMTKDLLSGEDSGLKNIWDEICVQVRFEHSIYWGVYLNVIETIIGSELDKRDLTIRTAIWLQSDEGRTWAEEEDDYQDYKEDPDYHEYRNRESTKPDVNDFETSYYILHNYVLSAADNWTNKRIEDYLSSYYED